MTDQPTPQQLPAEHRARQLIDQQLAAAGWLVQDRQTMNLYAGPGVAVREVIMAPGHGRSDYVLYIDKRAAGVIEAKPEGRTLSGVEWQSAKYAQGLQPDVRLRAVTIEGGLPFVFEASGSETHFTNGYDPNPRSRSIFAFPRPESLARHVREAEADATRATWRAKVRHLPPLDVARLRRSQVEALHGIEQSLAEQRFDRSLVQMATGAGKTFTAVVAAYRLLKYGGFNRILFLVDRNNLADQTLAEFQNYQTPDDGRRFTEIYNVDKLSGAGMLGSSHVVISTIQRVFRVLENKDIPVGDDPKLDAFVPKRPVRVAYNAQMPPETFDFVVVDEAHRSIYGVWRGVLDYFDAHIAGLTATPGKQTFAFFRQNLVSEYTYPRSVADGVNVDFDVYLIKTRITEQGSVIEAGTVVPKINRRTRVQRLELLENDLRYSAKQVDRDVTAKSQIRLVLETFRDRLFTEIFPGRSAVPKTLIFCKDDAHAEEVVRAVREVFGQGNDFAAKITYQAKDPKGHLKAFRTSASLRVAVTVDMIATGTDIKPLECVFFMRDVRSAQYFEQMKGRGARTIESADFQAVTPDATEKTRFVIVDAVKVTQHPFVDAPLNRITGASLKGLLGKAAALSLTEADAATLASKISKLELQLTDAERSELDAVAGEPIRDIVRRLVDAVDPDVQARAAVGSADPQAAIDQLIERAAQPLASNPELRARILELGVAHDRTIDDVSLDGLIDAYGVIDTGHARSILESWFTYLMEHRDEITAIQLLTEAEGRRIPFADIKDLGERISRPPYNWTTDVLWAAYVAVEVDVDRIRHSARHTLTDLVSLLRFTLGLDSELVPYGDRVRERYAAWLLQQQQAGTSFTKRQKWWIDRMVEVIAASAGITLDDLDAAPFAERGGIDGALRDLGPRVATLIDQLDGSLTA